MATEVPTTLIHGVLLGENNIKVSVDATKDEDVDLSIPTKSGPSMVGDAIGAIVAWPKDLVICTSRKKPLKPALTPVAVSNVPPKLVVKFKETERILPMFSKYLYSHAFRLMHPNDSVHVGMDEAIFGHPKTAWVGRDDILQFIEMKQIGATHMLVYMGYIYNFLKKKGRADSVTFVDPGCVPYIGGRESEQSQHIADRLQAGRADNICLIPYNMGSAIFLEIIQNAWWF